MKNVARRSREVRDEGNETKYIGVKVTKLQKILLASYIGNI